MSNLIIDNHIIKQDIKEILTSIKAFISNGKLKDVIYKNDNVRVSCPVHKNGQEAKASCEIYIGDSEDLVWGAVHCFACGFKGQLFDFIAEVCDTSVQWAKVWLKTNFTYQIIEGSDIAIDEPIVLTKNKKVKSNLRESILNKFQSWHPYMHYRKLTKEVCSKFNIMYDPESECIVFPVRDKFGNLKFLTRRSITSKKFIIDKDIEKEVYLLDNIIKNKIKEVYVCESQINSLTLESWGYNAIALLGTGTDYQYNVLKTSGIIKYNLCFDGDEAGEKAIKRFIENMPNVFITIINIPKGKDVNDLTKDEFDNLSYIDYN